MKRRVNNKPLFYTEKEFGLEQSYMEEYLQNITNERIYYFGVNTKKSKTHELYGETLPEEKVFSEPIELHVVLELNTPEKEERMEGFIYNEKLTIKFAVLISHLEDHNINIQKGDYVVYMSHNKDLTFEVTDLSNIDDYSALSKNYRPHFKLYQGVLITDSGKIKLNLPG